VNAPGAGLYTAREPALCGADTMRELLLTPLPLDVALLAIRLVIGACFVVHALGKLGLVGTGNMAGFVAWLRSEGVPMPAVQARLAMLSELGGGTALALGLYTRPAALLLVFTMIMAARIGHKNAGYLITNDPPGAEYTINLAAIVAMIAWLGPGGLSLDRLIYG
jgi:putative oxidoreductase